MADYYSQKKKTNFVIQNLDLLCSKERHPYALLVCKRVASCSLKPVNMRGIYHQSL